jgi:hypothetical protein
MKIKKLFPPLFALAGVAAMASMPAQAAKQPAPEMSCADSRITSHAAYDGQCQGSIQGNITADLVASFGDDLEFGYFGASKGNGGPFDDTPHGQSAGSLKLTQALFGQFVLGIKAGNSYSLYLFDAGDGGVGSIDFDTIGVSGRHGDKLSHAFVFTPGSVLPRQPPDLPTDGAKGNDLSPPTLRSL